MGCISTDNINNDMIYGKITEHPLKIVVSVEGDTTTVITNYSLKKGREK
jgi:hypothetical protein